MIGGAQRCLDQLKASVEPHENRKCVLQLLLQFLH